MTAERMRRLIAVAGLMRNAPPHSERRYALEETAARDRELRDVGDVKTSSMVTP